MAWFSGKVSLGNFPDLAGAVNKLQESVKNIEKNFDSALGLEEKSDTGTASSEGSGLWPVMSFIGPRSEDKVNESTESDESPKKQLSADAEAEHSMPDSAVEYVKTIAKKVKEEDHDTNSDIVETEDKAAESTEAEDDSLLPTVPVEDATHDSENSTLELPPLVENDSSESLKTAEALKTFPELSNATHSPSDAVPQGDLINDADTPKISSDQETFVDETSKEIIEVQREEADENGFSNDDRKLNNLSDVAEVIDHEGFPSSIGLKDTHFAHVEENREQMHSTGADIIVAKEEKVDPNVVDETLEVQRLKKDLKAMEAALQGAAKQAQSKADEIAKLMNENEHLATLIEDLKKKSNYDAEIESLKEEYHEKVANLERKLYALTKERDALRREQSKKSDAATLLKEKDEIIKQVMAEGEELSKKQATQESTIRKLRAQIREMEEEKKALTTKLQLEETKVESMKKDKAATEKLLQETNEKHQTELSTQKDYYTNALAAAKEAEALAEVKANTEARSEITNQLREAEERESLLVQAIEELRQTLTRKEQQFVFREEMLRRDIEDLQQRYQASERRCEELVSQVPESTRPLLRQIEAMQETAARRGEAWAAVERSLNSRLQEAEARAAASEEKERSINERLSQTLSRINVLEAQISCLRAEQTQLSKSLEKERHRAGENRQEFLAVKEEADTQRGRVVQLEAELKELRDKHKAELQDSLLHRELLQQEFDREKSTRLELEKASRTNPSLPDRNPSGNLSRKLSNSSSADESVLFQPSFETLERRNSEPTTSPFFPKTMTPSTYESALRQKEGEIASYISRLTSMESIRDSLAEELVKITEECEKLRSESALLPGLRVELDALRRRHSAALELMGERDEELEELRADIVDLKEMYREQVNLLVNQLQTLTSSNGIA